MNEYEFCQGVLSAAYLGMLRWVSRWIKEDEAGQVAAAAFNNWLIYSVTGSTTQYGPYKELYRSAEFQMRHWELGHANVVPFKVWVTVPVPSQEFLSELCQAYVLVYKGVNLGQVTLEERALALTMVRGGRFGPARSWTPAADFSRGPQVRHILGRVIQDLRAHRCTSPDCCEEYSRLRKTEELRGARWRADYLFHARENVHGH